MRFEIPDKLARDLAVLAKKLSVDVKDAVAEALNAWVAKHDQKATRLPDSPSLDNFISAPTELPKSTRQPVPVTKSASERLPDPVIFEE